MRNIFLVIQKEFFIRIKSKTFIIMTLLGPFLVFSFGYLIKYLSEKNQKGHTIVIYDETKIIGQYIKQTEQIKYLHINEKKLSDIKKDITDNQWDGLLYIPMPKSGNMSAVETNIVFYYNSNPSVTVVEKLKKDLNDRIREIKLNKSNVPLEKIYDAETEVLISLVSFTNQKDSILLWEIKSALGGVLGILIYLFIMIYGSMIMKSVLNEKTSRVVEVVVSSVKPFHLMVGKIISNAFAGILQFTTWGIVSTIIFFVVRNSVGIVPLNIQLPSQTENADYAVNTVNDAFISSVFEVIELIDFKVILFMGIVLFLLGFLLYSSVLAAIGAIVESDKDTSQFMLPITLPLILSIYLGFSILENPDGNIAFWLSMIPFTSPVVMMVRIIFGVPIWQVWLSIFILIMSFILIIWISAKLYKRGIITYSKTFSYRDILKILTWRKK